MTGFIILLVYIAIFVGSFLLIRFLVHRATNDYTSLKTVTFGDESAVVSNRWASVISVVTIFLIWGAFTGSKFVPGFLQAPSPFVGETSFVYTLDDGNGNRDDATVHVKVFNFGEDVVKFKVEPGDGIAKDDAVAMTASRTQTVLFDKNDEAKRKAGASVVAIEGDPISPGTVVTNDKGRFTLTDKGAISFTPPKGLQMDPVYLPPPEAVVERVVEIGSEGYRGSTLAVHLGYSLFRVIAGFIAGALVGIPLGYAMGLNGWFRGWFDPIVEFMRPVPPLALIPLIIIWFGIGEVGKIILLFLAALWIMAIAARSGVSGVNISKVHAAYSLGASKWQIMRHVIVPNSLPEIFTGARVAMGVCWGTVVAAELVAASEGAGMMIMVASKFTLTDIVLMGIILIGVIGFGIDILMRKAENILVPWKGKH
ncbi:ABC transporter permease subunit [Alisedimentitalea sp. MJ-SS2]|uniref:ABC transporter permease n=1 Tax=Aliisedimentitalea sp. MJ-SS2 TaxID=3049795 RepID=UPI00290A3C3A|nr:ABC transporter permease subunit [Alisedimentitalea sp. MJ-SS2]MDU8929970.1 ABC transporter permease subunit [Alisedimentitalea sp. MJ-SS2]